MALAEFNPAALPVFSDIHPENIEPSIKSLLDKNRDKLKQLLANTNEFTWDNLMQPLEEMNNELHNAWSPIGHLHSVMESEPLRDAYNKTIEHLTAYHTEISLNETLFKAISAIAKSPNYKSLTPAQKKIIEYDLRDFRLAGIHLPADKKAHLAELNQELSKLTTKFSENLLDASNAWKMHVTDVNQLKGLPPQALQLAADTAKQRNLEGYVLTLDYPSYSTAVKYLDDRAIRETLYEAYCTRASDQGPNAGMWDNSTVMFDIMRVQTEIANLVGFKNYAEYSLATKMAKTPEEVMGFLQDLVKRSKPIAEKEYQELANLAKQLDGIDHLEAWDLAYYSEKLQQNKFSFTQEDFRPYFPIHKVLNGLFTVVNKLYGITVHEEKNINVWHPQAKFFTLRDQSGQLRAGFYIDLYARPHKRDGAWMDDCRTRFEQNGHIQLPVAFLTCNFMRPVDNKPALLTHDDVITLFHEFGHCLHHMLTKVNLPSVAGINGVPWDAVEFPSQFMENFCWEKEAMSFIAEHYETHAPFPNDLYQKMLAAKHFQTGLQMVRQLEFALFDFHLHLEFDPAGPKDQIQKILNDVRKQVAAYQVPAFNRFQHSFSHIFAGGYSAGYYSYKWAEVLSSDAYAAFEEHGLFDHQTGKNFMENILEVGGVRDPMDSFVAFRGRKPTIDALLRHSGIM
ncbi:MAG TPA: M3 family metallopeptidase [Gammaproteobacteria bacterium]|nr:M3 family metallopeptidase [Gammaproteobacteria bacterium]